MFIDLFVKYLLAFAIVFDTTIAWFVLLKNPKRSLNQAYFLMVCCITVWQIGNFAISYFSFQSEFLYIFFLRVPYVASSFVAGAVLYFLLLFPNQIHNKKYAKIIAAISSFFALLSFTPLILYIDNFVPGIQRNYFSIGPVYYIFALYIMSMFSWVIWKTLKNYINEKNPVLKKQRSYLLIAFSIPAIIGCLTNLVIPLYQFLSGGDQYVHLSVSNIGPASSILISSIIAYTILRHRMMNIKLIIARQWISLVVYILSVITFFLFLLFIQQQTHIIVAESSMWTVFLLIAITLAIAHPLRLLIHWLIGGIIKKEYIDLYQWTDEERTLLEQCDNPEKWARSIMSRLMKQIPLESAEFIVYNHLAGCYSLIYPLDKKRTIALSEEWIQSLTQNPTLMHQSEIEHYHKGAAAEQLKKMVAKQQITYLLPLFAYRRLVGVLLLGQKIDGKPFTHSEIACLHETQQRSAVLIWNILQAEYVVQNALEQKQGWVGHSLATPKA